MPERDPLIGSYSHLRDFPRSDDALLILRKISSMVKPIMRARGWKVPELAEFYPDDRTLLGLNVNRGMRILLRLRFATDHTLFLPMEQIIDTMLHELVHIVRGSHDAQFHALWNQLRDEYDALIRKGYTGEGFLSEGRWLGGAALPLQEARRLARAAAAQRLANISRTTASGRRLGGRAPEQDEDVRRAIADAAERRKRTLRGCGNATRNDDEIQVISESATRNGFRTQAEEDAANDAAIAQALWELVQEEEMERYGSEYVPVSAEHPMGNGGGAVRRLGEVPRAQHALQVPQPEPPRSNTEKGAAAVVTEEERVWTCNICTLHNPPPFLCCDACGTERDNGDGDGDATITWGLADPRPAAQRQTPQQSRQQQQQAGTPSGRRPGPVVFDLTGSSPPRRTATRPQATAPEASRPPPPPTWTCSFCGNIMAREWWSCSRCGTVKDSSR